MEEEGEEANRKGKQEEEERQKVNKKGVERRRKE